MTWGPGGAGGSRASDEDKIGGNRWIGVHDRSCWGLDTAGTSYSIYRGHDQAHTHHDAMIIQVGHESSPSWQAGLVSNRLVNQRQFYEAADSCPTDLPVSDSEGPGLGAGCGVANILPKIDNIIVTRIMCQLTSSHGRLRAVFYEICVSWKNV